MSKDPRDFYQALEELDALDLPFDMSEAYREDGRVVLRVASKEVEQAVAYFEAHPFTLGSGVTLPVEILGLGGCWISDPIKGWAGRPTPLPLDELVGLEAREAARLANESGWLVRAYEPGAPLTADHQPGRLNLAFSTEGIVLDANVG